MTLYKAVEFNNPAISIFFCIRLQYFLIVCLCRDICIDRHVHVMSQIAKHNTHFSLSHWIYIWIYFPLFHFFPVCRHIWWCSSACVLVTYLNTKKNFSVSVGYKKQQIFMLNMIMLLVQFIWKECILVPSQSTTYLTKGS